MAKSKKIIQPREPKLDRCPFCSKKPKIGLVNMKGNGVLDLKWTVVCITNGHNAQVFTKTYKGAIRKWNGR